MYFNYDNNWEKWGLKPHTLVTQSYYTTTHVFLCKFSAVNKPLLIPDWCPTKKDNKLFKGSICCYVDYTDFLNNLIQHYTTLDLWFISMYYLLKTILVVYNMSLSTVINFNVFLNNMQCYQKKKHLLKYKSHNSTKNINEELFHCNTI